MTASKQCKQAGLKSLAELAPETGKLIELMEWLASPDFGALNMGQAAHIARSIARGQVPHVKMENGNG